MMRHITIMDVATQTEADAFNAMRTRFGCCGGWNKGMNGNDTLPYRCQLTVTDTDPEQDHILRTAFVLFMLTTR